MQLANEQVAPFIGGKITVTGNTYFSNKKISKIFVERGSLRVVFEGSSYPNYEALLDFFEIIKEEKGKLSLKSKKIGECVSLSSV